MNYSWTISILWSVLSLDGLAFAQAGDSYFQVGQPQLPYRQTTLLSAPWYGAQPVVSVAQAGGGPYTPTRSAPPLGPIDSCGPCEMVVADPACCRPPTPAKGLFGGCELTWMRARFDQNVALIVDPPVGNTLTPFDYDYQLAPRAWLGWQAGSGLGVRTTFFRYEDSAATESFTAIAGLTPVYVTAYGAGGNLSRTTTASVGQTLVSNHSLTLQILDFEGTYPWEHRAVEGLCGVGVRIVDLEQDFRSNVFNPDSSLEESIGNRLRVSGAGPTLSFVGSNRLAAIPVGGYVSGRGSLLMVQSEQKIYEMKGAYTTELEDIANQHKVLGNFELGMGLQLEHALGDQFAGGLRQGPTLFARVGYETQLWLGAGGPIDSDSALGLDGIVFSVGLSR